MNQQKMVNNKKFLKENNDAQILVHVLTKGLPEHLQVHPAEDDFKYADADNFFLTENELLESKKFDDDIKTAEVKIKEYLSKIMDESEAFDLYDELECVSGLAAELNMKIIYREGLLRGFRLAQFFLQEHAATGNNIKRTRKVSTS